MSVLLDRLTLARQQVAQCEHDLREVKDALANREIIARVGVISAVDGDYKALGPNESAQKIEIAYRVACNPDIGKFTQLVETCQHALDLARVELECALDARIERQYELNSEYARWQMDNAPALSAIEVAPDV